MKASYENANFLVRGIVVLAIIILSAMLLMITEPIHTGIAISEHHCSKGLPCLTPSHQNPPSTSSPQTSSNQNPPSTSSHQNPPSTQAPMATSGDKNVYVAWWTNNTGNDEVMFKASGDAGKIFGNKINLSNSPKSESQNAQIAASGSNVYVSWWERNATSNEPVLRASNDNGKTFGKKIMINSNNNSTAGSSSS